jgi:hypothetical membrane protein
MNRQQTWGAALWLLRPAYILVELVVAAATTGGYRLADDTVSDLGAVGCSPASCSPRHELMNGTFVGVGLLLALGAVLLAARLGPAVTVLLVIAGLSSVATGLAPIDENAMLHTLAATPLFLCQPLALLLLARALRTAHVRLAGALLLTGSVTAAAAVGYLLVGDGPGAGALERLALWPVLVALAAVAAVVVRATVGSDGPAPPAGNCSARQP